MVLGHSVFCASLEFQGLENQVSKKQSIYWQVGEEIIVAVTAVSTSHHADVEDHLLTECQYQRLIYSQNVNCGAL